ncbi:MAG: DUF488 domain-containing protein [Rhodospirillaceae bacterium]|nr:DUF488 domain-containing protein [Rhodospirillaceae bacterium]
MRIDLVVDVRRFPRSRRHPQFDIERLPATPAGNGIGYQHIEALGGRRRRSLTDDARPTRLGGGGFSQLRRLRDDGATSGCPPYLDRFGADPNGGDHVCGSAVVVQCHRRIISDYLLIAGIDVIHILGDHETQPAELTSGVAPQANGTIHYPPLQPRLL